MVPEFPPANDIIIKMAKDIGEHWWALVFICFNYVGIMLIHIIQKNKSGLRTFRNDLYYHVLWLGLIPLGYILIFPQAYEALGESWWAVQATADPTSTFKLARFYGEWLVSVLAAVGAVLSVFAFMRLWRLSCHLEKIDYWWITRGKLTPAGIFYLGMCTLVAWSAVLFFVNAVYGEYLILKIVSETAAAARINIESFVVKFGNLIAWVLALWSVVTIGFVFLLWYARRRAKVAKEFDLMRLVAGFITALVFVALFIIPVFQVHHALGKWPITWSTIITAGTATLGLSLSAMSLVEIAMKYRSQQVSGGDKEY